MATLSSSAPGTSSVAPGTPPGASPTRASPKPTRWSACAGALSSCSRCAAASLSKTAPSTRSSLRVGLAIWLTNDLRIEVASVSLPAEVLALEGDGLASHILSNVCSLRVEPRPTLLPGLVPEADATLWHDGLGWVIRVLQDPADSDFVADPGSSLDLPLVAGDSFQVAGRTFRATSVALELAGHLTTVAVGSVQSPLKLILRYDNAHIHREGDQPLALGGISARILSEPRGRRPAALMGSPRKGDLAR